MGDVIDRHIAIQVIDEQAQENELSDIKAIKNLLGDAGAAGTDTAHLAHQLLYSCDATINFHPDRFSQNGRLIIDNLLEDGKYHNQYRTGTSNGGRTAYAGGDRDLWEKRLFSGAYHDHDIELFDRPKYGALNIHNYLDGASARFGSCFFTLKPHVIDRCTFAFGDSFTNPEVMGTAQHFFGILRALFQETHETGRLLGKPGFDISKTVEYILAMRQGTLQDTGRNLDHCIETHIHGDISLLDDVDSFYLDASYQGTDIEKASESLADQYDIKLYSIPKRQYAVADIDDEWKGPMARPLAERIIEKFGDKGAQIDAALIGLGSQDSVKNPDDWLDIGSEYELFQNFKYLWHFVAYKGR